MFVCARVCVCVKEREREREIRATVSADACCATYADACSQTNERIKREFEEAERGFMQSEQVEREFIQSPLPSSCTFLPRVPGVCVCVDLKRQSDTHTPTHTHTHTHTHYCLFKSTTRADVATHTQHTQPKV